MTREGILSVFRNTAKVYGWGVEEQQGGGVILSLADCEPCEITGPAMTKLCEASEVQGTVLGLCLSHIRAHFGT